MLDLPKIDFHARLDRAVQLLGDNAMLVLAQPQGYRNSTVENQYRQDALFHYLTGFGETDAALLIRGNRAKGDGQVTLFLRDKDAVAELWNGIRLGVNAAKSTLAIDDAYPWEQLWTKLPELLVGSAGLYFSLGLIPDNDRRVIETLRKVRVMGARTNGGILPLYDTAVISGQLRILKGPEEVARMRAAASITRGAFKKVLGALKPGMNEREVYGLLVGEFLAGGAEMEAYGSIVAGGNNACVLHYRDNNMPLKDGDLILIDAGSQVDNYASDVTRTYPINGKFTTAQKALYEIVLKSQKDAIAACKPGTNWQEVQMVAFRTIAQGLIDLGLIKASVDEALEKNLHKHFCPHSISHWIGLDVHDAGVYSSDGKPVPFKPGMYFSVEPGIYINASDETVPLEYRGIGIRIEDDVLITDSGCEVITSGIPKEVSEITR